MATTSIWRVKGWLGKVVIYAENPEKTANPKFYADRELNEQDGQQLSDVIRYAINPEKTQCSHSILAGQKGSRGVSEEGQEKRTFP